LSFLPLQYKQGMLQQMAAPDNFTPAAANGTLLLERIGWKSEPDGKALASPMTDCQPEANNANPELAVKRGQGASP
jgi:hypothetical protein